LVVLGFVPGALIGGGAVWLGLHGHDHGAPAVPAVAPAAAVAKKKPLYQCPMHPSITSDHPGDCPICGMKLVEVDQKQAEPKHDESPAVKGLVEVTIDPTRQQLIGLRTAKVSKGSIGNAWRTVARIQVAPSRVRKTNVKVEGFVERIFVDFVGQSVRKGQPLFSIYSPSLVAAQSEYLLALSSRDALVKAGALAENGESLVAAARRRLELWDVPASEIDRLTTTREPSKTLTLVSPIAGVVTAKSVVQGARVSPGEAPYEITDLGEVWVMADAYESDISRIHPHMKATLSLTAYPNRTFTGMVAFIDPLLDPKTRTAKVHLHFANPTRELKPEMFGEVTLQGVSQEGLQIPADAVIRAGAQDVVFVALGSGRFEPRAVQLGARSGDAMEVKGGVDEGTEVVTRANFLVDSESQLRASLAAIGGK
jgi:Cu(I)/Ag(I) efflux system membrane fusion protein